MSLPVAAKLPYFCDAANLPGPLPSMEEIHNASLKSTLSPRRTGWGDYGGVCVVRDMFIVKFGSDVTENEGNTLLFIERSLNIPAPRLYAMYNDPSSGLLYLVMEYIPGKPLDSTWESLSIEAKSSIAAQLKQTFTEMRSLNSPPEFIGGMCGGCIPDPVFRTEQPDPYINGPFKAGGEVGSALALASQKNAEQNGQDTWIPGFFSRHLPEVLKACGVSFTHGDLKMQNILVEKVASDAVTAELELSEDGQQHDYRVTGIVDWESAGWYPEYWEYASAIARFQSQSNWPASLDTILTPYPLETAMFLLVLRDLQFL